MLAHLEEIAGERRPALALSGSRWGATTARAPPGHLQALCGGGRPRPRPQGAPPSGHRVEAATRTPAAGGEARDGSGAAHAAGSLGRSAGGWSCCCRCRACGGAARAARRLSCSPLRQADKERGACEKRKVGCLGSTTC
jgi:hypothetical protein